ncbi:hypothetical protein Tco_0938230 [Tanacetum coccineum]|uniref:Uncharacterized protein n=1 Tax=Tanacetum coccineum TaxID=301880 RepID=A0ABQ5DH81_9ASTR
MVVIIVKIVSTAVHFGTAGEFSVACTAGIVTVVGWYGPSKMHFLKASPFDLWILSRWFHSRGECFLADDALSSLSLLMHSEDVAAVHDVTPRQGGNTRRNIMDIITT